MRNKTLYLAACILMCAQWAIALDPVANFAEAVIAGGGISSAATTLTVTTGYGARFPAAVTASPSTYFNAVIWNSTDYRSSAQDPNVEIVRVTNRSGDVFTISRAQEGTSAVAHATFGKTYRITNAITAKMFDDITAALAAGGVTDATYITQTAHAGLSAEQALSSLATGIVKVTTGTGVLSTAVAGDFPTLNQSTSGNAATSTALAADPADCAGVNFSRGINASGVAQCAQPSDVTGNAATATLAASATALAADPGDCAGVNFSQGINASGVAQCAQPSNVTGNAATATALAANPSDCSPNQFANAIAASGNLTCAQPSAADLSNGTTGTGAVVLATGPAVTGITTDTLTTSGNIFLGSTDLILRRAAAANAAMGAADAAAPVSQTFSVQNCRAGTDSNCNGGDLTIIGSLGTGTSVTGAINMKGGSHVAGSGAGGHTAITRQGLNWQKRLTNNTTTTVTNATLSSNTSQAVIVHYRVAVTDASNEQQSEVGFITCTVLNKAGAFSGNVCTKSGNTQQVTAGTLTVTWSITAAAPAAVQINANSSLTPSSGYPRLTYNIECLGDEACTEQ